MPRTTIDLDAAVLGELRRRGRREHKSMGRLASELLADALAREERPPAPRFRWMTADLGRPLVDLEDKEAVQAVLDGRS
jgi:plasmid stability protein